MAGCFISTGGGTEVIFGFSYKDLSFLSDMSFLSKDLLDIPEKKLRRKLVHRYREGGVQFELEVKKNMGPISTKWAGGMDIRGRMLIWVYVGDNWWAMKKSNKYLFGRMYAVENDIKTVDRIFEGLWNELRHGKGEYPCIVYSLLGRRGYIVGYNKWEILVQWEDEFMNRGLSEPTEFDFLKFEYEQDYKKFKRMFKK